MRIISEGKPTAGHFASRLRRAWIWVVLAGLLAMGGALKACFYMDDFHFILNSKGDGPAAVRFVMGDWGFGSSKPDALLVSVFQLLPTGMTLLTNAVAPLNPAAAHVWNLAIHLVLSLLVLRSGERLLRELGIFDNPLLAQQAALVGALWFAVHPLGTEPVHYAKCHMVQLVALGAFWATAELLSYLRSRDRRTAIRVLLAVGLTVISYFPGTILIGLNFLAVGLWRWSCATEKTGVVSRAGVVLRKMVAGPWQIAVSAVLMVSAGWVGMFFLRRFGQTVVAAGDQFPVHLATQARVFWEYLGRMAVPVNLSSDHYQPWSTFRDPGTVIAIAGFAGLIGGLVLAMRKISPARGKGLALLGLLSVLPLAMRMLYRNIEIMVEYRAYASLPWVGLLAGCGIVALAHRWNPRLRWMPAAAVGLVFLLLSVQRGQVWRSQEGLAKAVLEQYPLNNRARVQLQSLAIDAGDYAEVLRLHQEILQVREKIREQNKTFGDTVRVDPHRADQNVFESYQFEVMSRAELQGCAQAVAYADQIIQGLRAELPEHFRRAPGSGHIVAAPLLEARATVERARAAGYVGSALIPQ